MKKKRVSIGGFLKAVLTKAPSPKCERTKKISYMKLFIQAVAFLLITTVFQNCAPVFSELQSARTVGKNKIELTPSASVVNFTEDNETEKIQNHTGLQVAYGITPNVDIRLRYEYIWFNNDEFKDGISVLGIGPKFSLLKNKIALSLPVGKVIGKYSKDYFWEFHPTLLFTIPALKDRIDINLSPKYLMIFGDEYSDLMAFNLGLSLSNNLNKWCVRPEFGFLINPDETAGHYNHFSLGFSYAFGK